MMDGLEYVFWDFTVFDLLFAAGRYIITVSAGLLAVRHVAWFARCKWRRPTARTKTVRNATEMIVGVVLAALYGRHILQEGATSALLPGESLVTVWLIAFLFTVLLVSRTPPPHADDY